MKVLLIAYHTHCKTPTSGMTGLWKKDWADGLGRLRADVSATFGRDAEWDGTPAKDVIFGDLQPLHESGA